jgi:hypothetical protein
LVVEIKDQIQYFIQLLLLEVEVEDILLDLLVVLVVVV